MFKENNTIMAVIYVGTSDHTTINFKLRFRYYFCTDFDAIKTSISCVTYNSNDVCNILLGYIVSEILTKNQHLVTSL